MLLLLLLSRFSRVWLCATPETAAHQAPPPWDSPGKNTGVGCHFLLQRMKVKSEIEVVQSCPTLKWPRRLQPTRLLHPWDFPGKSTGVGCHCLPPWTIVQAKTLEWVAYPFSRGSFWPRNRPRRPRVSCIAGGFFINWAIREARVSTGDFKFLFTQDCKSPTKRRKWKSPVLSLDK